MSVPSDLESALRMKTMRFLVTHRSWLDLYGNNVRPVAPFGSASSRPHVDHALIHRTLPDELLYEVSEMVENYKILQSNYDGSWRKMWLLRPRIRTDCLLLPILENFSIPKNSSQKIKEVAKCINFRASKADCVFKGHYTLSDDKVEAAVLYPGLRPTVLRIRLRLRGTTAGANNRMDLLSLVTSGVNDTEVGGPEEDILGVVEGWEDDETHNPDVPAVSHKRGMKPFVFVPFEEVEKSVLNLPVEKMDYYVSG
ncbi:hypothetical protein SAY87_010211 [Trapa incisa]|uniref:F-box protein Hrt3/FBXO9 C-terminal domain-containing protein n=1 Tax=Trapa incisa TaxID=236973 RepID=A0AAN7GL66_9MYRT|nr:hypothetical protein SAY87_010211 [Trapa incisa]